MLEPGGYVVWKRLECFAEDDGHTSQMATLTGISDDSSSLPKYRVVTSIENIGFSKVGAPSLGMQVIVVISEFDAGTKFSISAQNASDNVYGRFEAQVTIRKLF